MSAEKSEKQLSCSEHTGETTFLRFADLHSRSTSIFFKAPQNLEIGI